MENIKESIAEMMGQLNVRMASFEAQMNKAPASPSATGLATEFAAFRSFTVSAFNMLQKQVEMLARGMDHLDMRSRRKILLVHGIPEAKKEDVASTAVRVIAQHVAGPELFCTDDIARSHRMGRIGDKPRPILVKFKDLALRNNVWFAKAKLKGSGVTLSEFLTKPRHEAFMQARQRVGVKQCWTRDGCVVVLGADGKQHRIVSLAELDQVCPPASLNSGVVAPKASGSKAPDASSSSGRAKRTVSKK
ncbi:hypothetical protein JYU34_012572 [Plutella xylostella]|uniref:Uncharacterized protein n=1 Tax=Plutella xylostella TaxID=51655 RepID=A0ABQ7QD07_PLUXY|nr:uncharacterized protein LOC125489125 [Plutella xylostella]XP_048485460.1 uncharacterized protein LOC125490398 [Plutella xylostella]KAG7302625.1 hypothetical protein JYU34_012572 [Plutella xylostella]